MDLQFRISMGILRVFSGSFSYEIKASSGKGGCLNNPSKNCQRASFEGPIPVGIYYIDPNAFNDPNLIWDIGRRFRGDWGDWRVKLKPSLTTNLYARSGFFLHCGDTAGSAGCIDVGGGIWGNNYTDKLKKDILAAKDSIKLEVLP